MTAEEAIKILEVVKAETDWTAPLEYQEAFDMAIEAIKKQIPMKMPGSYTDYKCDVCGRRIRSGKGSSSFGRDNFCQRCGQAIDWSES